MKSGRVYEGRIVGESESSISIQRDGVTLGFEKVSVEKIEREALPKVATFLPDADKLLLAAKAISPEDWVQIPATVIDDGILRNVPYRSYRAGMLELNIYGDPDAPAGIEIGSYSPNISIQFKRAVIGFIGEITGAKFDDGISAEVDKKRIGEIDYEVTPPTAPDAYGAWWISAYNVPILESIRVADNEINEITTKRAEITRAASEIRAKKQIEALADAWTAADLKKAVRPTAVAEASPTYTAPASYGTGRVWVKSYYRKDGTFVNGYSRRR